MSYFGWWSSHLASTQGFYIFTDLQGRSFAVTVATSDPQAKHLEQYEDLYYVGPVAHEVDFYAAPFDEGFIPEDFERIATAYRTPIPPHRQDPPTVLLYVEKRYIDLEF